MLFIRHTLEKPIKKDENKRSGSSYQFIFKFILADNVYTDRYKREKKWKNYLEYPDYVNSR
jgi:hypothetical protein